MTDDRLAVTLTVGELAHLIGGVVRRILDERSAVAPGPGQADEEMTTRDLVRLFRLAEKSGPKTLWNWRRTQGFPAPRRNGKNRVTWLRSEVNEWRAAREVSGPGAVRPVPIRRARSAR